MYFLCRQKVPKNSARGRTSRSLLLLVNCQRQYNSSVPRSPLQAFLPSAGCCGSHCVRQFWKNIIAVLRLDVPRTMACCRQGSPLCCLRCRLNKLLMLAAKAQACLAFARLLATFAFSDGLPFAINNHRRVSRILSRTIVMSKKRRHR